MNITFRCDPALIDVLPRPVSAKAALPDWLRQMPPRAASSVHQRSIMKPCDVTVEAGQFSWNWPLPALATHGHPRAPLSFHVPEQIAGSPLAHGSRSAIKFNSFWTIELEPGWSLMAVHPINRDDLPFRLVTGLVDADRFNAVGINFPAVWLDAGFSGTLPRGMPIAQCYPVPRDAPALVCEPMSEASARGYDALATRIMGGPGVYRKGYRSKRGGA